MARKMLREEEIVEMLYQWHIGSAISQVKRSLGIDRKTIRKYIKQAEIYGFSRDLEVHHYNYYFQLASNIQNGLRAPIDKTPSYIKTSAFNGTIENLISKPYITAKHVYRILKKDYNYTLSYSSFKRYINSSSSNHLGNYIRNETGIRKNKKTGFGFSDNFKKDRLWLQKLSQGKFSLNEIRQELLYYIPSDDIAKLYNCSLNKSLRYRNRAIGILALCKGIPQNSIAEHLLIPKSSLVGHFELYINKGVSHIISDKGKRQLKHENQLYVDKVFSILHSPPSSFGFNRTSWRQRDIQKVMSDNSMPVSRHVIKRIIVNAGYRYRKARTVLTSTDPDYMEKVQKIKNILSNLGAKEKFFSIDEYGPFSVKLYGGKSLVPPGETKIVPQWQKSRATLIITAALELSTNQIIHFYSKSKNTAEMIRLLNILTDKYSEEVCIYFSWDAASWHASKELYKRVDEINSKDYREKTISPIVKLAPLPACAQFLNVIESVFSGMARAIIHNSDYKSDDDCKSAIDRYFAERNEHFQGHPQRAGNKIWGQERAEAMFKDSNNCKDPKYR